MPELLKAVARFYRTAPAGIAVVLAGMASMYLLATVVTVVTGDWEFFPAACLAVVVAAAHHLEYAWQTVDRERARADARERDLATLVRERPGGAPVVAEARCVHTGRQHRFVWRDGRWNDQSPALTPEKV